MATFTQWNRTRPLRRVVWVCGPEEVLRREVVTHYLASMPQAAKANLYPQAPGLWDYLLSSLPGVRCLVLRQAEVLPLAEQNMPVLLESLDELSCVIFVSAEDDFARDKDGQLAAHLASIKDWKNGQLIRCCRPSREEDLLTLIVSWWPGAGMNHASRLLALCGGDLTAVYQACEKARRAALPASPAALEHVSPRQARDDWCDAMLAGDRRRAMEAATCLPARARLRALGSLNVTFSQAAYYAVQAARGLGPDEIARRGISRFRQRQLAPHAGRYLPAQEIRCRRLLAMAEDALRSGAGEGVLEALTVLW